MIVPKAELLVRHTRCGVTSLMVVVVGEDLVLGKGAQQVPPLRYAPIGMTNLRIVAVGEDLVLGKVAPDDKSGGGS